MQGRIVDFSLGFNKKQRITLELEDDFRFQYDNLKDHDLSIDLKKYRKKRSLDANAYFHVLVSEIAKVQNIGNDEVKKNLVLEYGSPAVDDDGQYLGAMLPEGAHIEQFYPYCKLYKKKVVDGRSYDCYLFFKRTHTMDSKEMARLIDGAVYVAKENGIETLPPDKLALLEGL